jgi:hypothetical protein
MTAKKTPTKGASKKGAKKSGSRKGTKKQPHSDKTKATTLTLLKINRGSVRKTARVTGLPERTIARWRDGYAINADVRQMVKDESLKLADELEAIAFMCVGILPQRLESAEVRDVVGAMSQAIDKSLLLRGLPTQINANITAEELRSKYNEVVDRLLTKAKARGEKITREEIVERVIKEKPQTAPYLKLVEKATA